MTPPGAAWFDGLSGPARAGVWMTISAFCYAASAAIVRHLAAELPTFEIVFLRNLFGLACMLPWLVRLGPGALRTGRIGMHALRGMSSSVNISCQVGALAFIPIADMAAITFLQPVLGAIIAVIALGEAANGRRWTATLAGLMGALLIVRPGFEEINVGIMLALASATAGAIIAIMIKDMVRTESPAAIATYLFISQGIIMAIPAALVWAAPTWEQIGLLAALGVIGAILQVTFNRAMASADATVALPFNFTRLLWAALLGWLVFAEFPDAWTWIGGTIIFASSLYLARRGP